MYPGNNPLGFYKPHPETKLQKSFNRSRVRVGKITNSTSQSIYRMPEVQDRLKWKATVEKAKTLSEL
jgi:hypothetical protein